MATSKNKKSNGAHTKSKSNGYSSNGHSTNGSSHHHKPTMKPPKSTTSSLDVTWSLLLTFIISATMAFSIGWIARLVLLSKFGVHPYAATLNNNNNSDMIATHKSSGYGMSQKYISTTDLTTDVSGKGNSGPAQLPAPIIISGKEVPFTTYASKTFQMEGAATSHTLHIDRTSAGKELMSKSKKEFDGGPDFQQQTDDNSEEEDGWVPTCDTKSCSRGKEKVTADETIKPNDYSEHNDDSDGLHLPAGQHLLVDIKDVDSQFLNSEERLAKAMIQLTEETKLTLLSYHCHTLVPIGVSCAGVLLESHVAFHTWPLEGVITLDLFTCGGGLLVPSLPSIEKLFGVPQTPGIGETEDDMPTPTMLWSHKLRGFREGFAPGYVRSTNPLDGSLGRYVLGKLDFDIKRPLLSTKTSVQSVNIYEVMEPKSRDSNAYHMSLLNGTESYESTYPESFGPDKVLFLDGILQSNLYGDAPYHESIVHPAMITHEHPKRVAIIGGGEGATLREVLKYKSVEEVVILEIDQELVEICAEYMPEWSDCGDIEGSDAKSCFDDSRARVIYVDAFKWMLENFGSTVSVDRGGGEDKFDVIIMDALDPNTSVEIAGGLYNDTTFVDSVFNGLTAEGVFAVQMGKSKMNSDPSDEIGRFKDYGLMIQAMEQVGFESIHTYDEGHSRFYMPWHYLVALKHYSSRAGWHRTAPELQIELQQRLHKTKSGLPILRYFDATTMISFQLPPKAQETTYCRKEDEPWECDEIVGVHPEFVSLPSSEYLKVGKSGLGRGLFASKNIPKDGTLSLDESGKSFHFPPLTWSVIKSLIEWAEENDDTHPYVEDEYIALYTFAEGYGHGALLLGKEHFAVDSGIMLFMNHGCNGTSNYGYANDDNESCGSLTESNVDLNNPEEVSKLVSCVVNKASPFSPVFDRNLRHALNSGDYALRKIKKGEEVTTDYLEFAGDPKVLIEYAVSLRRICSGQELGDIDDYQGESQ